MKKMPKTRMRLRQNAQDGMAVVEFAIISSLFFFLVGVIVQGALIFNAWLVVTNAAREGARAGAPCYGRVAPAPTPTAYPVSLTCNDSDVAAAARSAAVGVSSSQLQVNANSTTTTIDANHKETTLTVTAQYPVPIVAPFVDLVLPNPFPVTASATVRVENQQ
jgi:Flp pilus assembly protein TadG